MNFNLTKFTYQNLFTETQIDAKFSYDKLERINSHKTEFQFYNVSVISH